MKTPDEIKKGLECQRTNDGDCESCAYYEYRCCEFKLAADALAYIQQLETERHQLLTKCERLERERDAAVNDIEPKCDYCAFKHNLYGEAPCPTEEELETDAYCFGFKWRGVCEENTKEE